MKKTALFSLAALTLAATACYKPLLEEPTTEAPKNLVRITVTAEKEIGGEDPESKVTYNPSNNKFGFDSDDKLQLLIGAIANNAITSQKSVILDMDSDHLGTFTGTIDLGDYALSDIRGAFLVKSAYSNANLYMNGKNLTMRSYVISSQTQSEGDVFTSGNGRAIFYTHIKSDWVHQQDDEITIDHLTLKLGSSIWEFHIYGTDRTGEKIKSVTVAAHSNTGNTANYTGCQELFYVSNGNFNTYGGTKYYSNTVTLTNPVTVGSDANSSPSIWLGIVGLGTNFKTGVVTIVTDKASYTRDFNSAEKKREKGAVYPININIGSSGSFTRHSNTLEYSTDGGSTWSESLPEASSTYTSLAVRGALSASALTSLASSLGEHFGSKNTAVDLDLGGCCYESTTFPAAFGNTSAASNITNSIKSIILPVNITTIATSGFRRASNLVSINLKNVQTIGNSTFSNCKLLATLSNMETLSKIGNTLFYNCSKLTGTQTFPALETIDDGANGTSNTYGTFTGIGATRINLPAIKTVGKSAFYNNSKIVTIDLGTSISTIKDNAFNGCTKLATIYCRATTPPTIANANAFTNAGSSVTGDKILYVPADAVAAYQEDAIWSTIGYTITAIP
ncbi:MAG: leucine-rich repeat domain-containing protein [Bacteroidales bacterium]|nr:leucine-rich repeat domain-containing protein [Bacteroidales bacterium]